uniref:Uncharacterized protein n=1 Tax=Bacillus phage KoopaTroopa TaxID=3234046 RepID=A0AB39C7B7_9CAUD
MLNAKVILDKENGEVEFPLNIKKFVDNLEIKRLVFEKLDDGTMYTFKRVGEEGNEYAELIINTDKIISFTSL